jgi:hypothetical protein
LNFFVYIFGAGKEENSTLLLVHRLGVGWGSIVFIACKSIFALNGFQELGV